MRIFENSEREFYEKASRLALEHIFDAWKFPPKFVFEDFEEDEVSLTLAFGPEVPDEHKHEADALFMAFVEGIECGINDF